LFAYEIELQTLATLATLVQISTPSERKQPDIELGEQVIVHESEERPRVLYIWVAAIST